MDRYIGLDAHASSCTAADVDRSRSPKDDKHDAFTFVEGLHTGAIRTRVYKGLGEFKLLRVAIPRESQAKRWAIESLIEGSFPPVTWRMIRLESHRNHHGNTQADSFRHDQLTLNSSLRSLVHNFLPKGRIRNTGGGGRWVQELKIQRIGNVRLGALSYRERNHPGF